MKSNATKTGNNMKCHCDCVESSIEIKFFDLFIHYRMPKLSVGGGSVLSPISDNLLSQFEARVTPEFVI